MPRQIGVVTTSRADYSHLYWVLHEICEQADLEMRLIVTAAHLSSEFGRAVLEIERDGFSIAARVESLMSSDTDVGMAKTIGVTTLGMADALARIRPDILLLIADRYEMLAPASVALALRIPIAHIEGGEVSEGAIDDAVRNALTKMSHIHFTPTENARRRVVAMGEEEWRVHRVGAPSLEHLERSPRLDATELASRIGVRVETDAAVVAWHPTTIAPDTLRETDAFFDALSALDRQLLFCFPNADAGSRALIERATRFCEGHAGAHLFVNLPAVEYFALLRHAGLMLGNSSSGIMETPSLRLPAVNVGMRQQGRERARNVIDAEASRDAILDAVAVACSASFRESLAGMENPYATVDSARRIVRILRDAPLGDTMLVKRAVPID
jgi:UDP-N-acetylglucosamine 2-epimerase (non-hydrolysing)/GDP/UDP-N,N'-diacetylbacillosamine 2-epimerase (hydrolysing)